MSARRSDLQKALDDLTALGARIVTGVRPSSAEQCRQNGWGPGTRLVGDEGYGPTVIEITAVGESGILAKSISHNGEPGDEHEARWTLSCREWQEVAAFACPAALRDTRKERTR